MTIPIAPQRVVCVVNYAMNDLFDIGFKPVGIPDGLGSSVLPEFATNYTSTEKIGPGISSIWRKSLPSSPT